MACDFGQCSSFSPTGAPGGLDRDPDDHLGWGERGCFSGRRSDVRSGRQCLDGVDRGGSAVSADSGEWGVELESYEADQERERQQAQEFVS